MKNQVVLILVAAAVVGGAVYGVMFTSLGNYFVPDGPRGYLLPMDCEQCRLDLRLGRVSAPHGHVVKFIEPADGLRRDGVFWRFLWQGNEAVCSREGFAFLPSQQPCPDAYRAWKEGRGREYADVLYKPMSRGE